MSKTKPIGWVVIDELGVHLFTGNMPRRGLSCWMGGEGVGGMEVELTEKERYLWGGLTRKSKPRPVYLSQHNPDDVEITKEAEDVE